MPGSDRFPAKILRLIGAIAIEHSRADNLLTIHLSLIYCRQIALGWPLFADAFFGKKVELLKKAVAELTPEEDDPGFLPRSKYHNALDLLSKLKGVSEHRNDLMHGIVQIADDRDVAVLRRPNRKAGGLNLDESTLSRVLADLRTIPGELALQILAIEADVRAREQAETARLKGSKIEIRTRLVTGRIGNRSFSQPRSTRKVIPPANNSEDVG